MTYTFFIIFNSDYMKNILYTFYNLMIYDLNKENSNYYFYYKNKLYLFYLVENEINTIEYTYSFFKTNNLECYEIIPNKDNKLITFINEKKYALLKIKGIIKYELNFNDFKYYNVNKEPLDWSKLWGDRLDYYSIQLRELGHNYQTVLNSYGFFEGLAENAILYYNMTLRKFNDNRIISIVHNRMKYPCYSIDYYNPLNFIVDYNVRDISEYIKSYIIMSNEYNSEEVIKMLEKINTNKLMFNLLFSRILYPTFYFDVFDKIILDNGEDSEIIPIINKTKTYIDTIKKIFYYFNQKYEMFNIEWINKNVEIKSQH